jgi:hypothetical protein
MGTSSKKKNKVSTVKALSQPFPPGRLLFSDPTATRQESKKSRYEDGHLSHRSRMNFDEDEERILTAEK